MLLGVDSLNYFAVLISPAAELLLLWQAFV
jgi:hypothetical protein